MAYFKATYTCGYCGCDDDVFFIANDEALVYNWMREGLYDYAMNYFDACVTLDDDERESSFDVYFEEFLEDCDFDVDEVTKEEIEDEYGEVDWVDIIN